MSVAAPLAELPMFVKAGSVIPMLPPDVATLAPYGRARGIVHLRDRAGVLELLAFPRAHSFARSGTGQAFESIERRGRWTLAVKGPQAAYRLQASLATLRHPFKPCAVTLGGRALAHHSWSFDRRTRVLRVRFRAGASALVVRGSCRQTGRTRG